MSAVRNLGARSAPDPAGRIEPTQRLAELLGTDSVVIFDYGVRIAVPLSVYLDHLSPEQIERVAELARSAAFAMTRTAARGDRFGGGATVLEYPANLLDEALMLAVELIVLRRGCEPFVDQRLDDLFRRFRALGTEGDELRCEPEGEIAQRLDGDAVASGERFGCVGHGRPVALTETDIEALRALVRKAAGAPS